MKEETLEHPKNGYSYAVVAGTYIGEMLIFIDSDEDNYNFISIPKNINRYIPKDKFEFGLDNQIIDIVGSIDPYVLELLEKQFDYNKDNDK